MFWKPFFGAVTGKIIAAFAIALFVAFGIGPDEWIDAVFDGAIGPVAVRWLLALFGAVTFIHIYGPWIYRRIFARRNIYGAMKLCPIHIALELLVRHSAWSRLQNALHCWNEQPKPSNLALAQIAAILISGYAANEEITLKGRPNGGVDPENIKVGVWHLAILHVNQTTSGKLRPVLFPLHGIEKDRLPNYELIYVHAEDISRIFPERDMGYFRRTIWLNFKCFCRDLVRNTKQKWHGKNTPASKKPTT